MSEFLEVVPEPGEQRLEVTLPPIGRIRAEVWALAWPVILSFGLDSILGLASMLMVGRLGAEAVGAVGLATQILGAVRAGIAAVGTGTVALVARYIGAGDRDSAEEVLKQSVIFGVIVSTIIAIPVIVFARPLMGLFQVKGEMAEMGARYLQVVMLSEPFQGIFLMCASGLRGAGDTRTPLWIGGIIDVLAIFFNYVLIFGKLGFPALGVDGSAVATLLAIAIGGLLFFWALSPAAIEQLIIQFGFVAYVAFVARYGPKEVAAYFIGVRILALSFLPGFGFSAASATLVGQGLGAHDPAFARKAGWESTKMAVVMMTALGLIFLLFAHQIAALFISDKQVIDYTAQFMYALAAAQPLMAIDWTITGALRGAGDSRFPLWGSLAGFYGMRLAVTIVISYYGGSITWIWWSLIADYIVRASVKSWRFSSEHWETIEV